MTGVRGPSWNWLYLLAACLLTLAASLWLDRGRGEACSMCGDPIDPALAVDLEQPVGRWQSFCTIRCAQVWLELRGAGSPVEATVRDALTGAPLDAYTAFFVQSEVVTRKANGNDIHAFQYRSDAAEHARRFNGREIPDPFQVD